MLTNKYLLNKSLQKVFTGDSSLIIKGAHYA